MIFSIKKIKYRKIGLGLVIAGLVPLLAGCSMDRDSQMALAESQKIRLEKSHYNDMVDTASLDQDAIYALADYYTNHGEGPVVLAVTYDPKSRSNTARHATRHATDIAARLQAVNVPVMDVDILPVPGQGDVSKTMIEYSAIFAHEPEGCEAMGGLEGKPTTWDKKYAIGCTINMQMARQIASPSDFLGREGISGGDGRPLSNIISAYRSGEPLPALQGETAIGE